MDRQEIKELLREVIGPNAVVADHNGWVSFCCPLAPWRHAGGKDTSPSSGISVKDGDTSVFHCWSCGSKGTVPWLLRQLEKYTGDSFSSIIRGIENGEFLGGSLPEWGDKVKKRTPDRYLDDTYIELYDSAVGHWYLRDRGITRETTKALGLLLDPEDSHGDERILFPVYNRHKQLHGITGRAVLDDIEPRIRDYHGLQKANALLGLHLVDTTDKYVIVVEGLFDFAMVFQYGYSVVATLHAGLTAVQADKLLDLGMPVVLMYDNDTAGKQAVKAATAALLGKLPLSVVKYPEREAQRGGKVICPKDPATCTMDEVDWMVGHARIV
jgi:DNA primase